MKQALTQKELKELLHYDPDTGYFTWKVNRVWKSAGRRCECVSKTGYIFIGVNRRRYTAHRLAVLYMTGEWPPHDVDHINGVRTDNRYSNLRLATRKQNLVNQGARVTSKSGIKGVHHNGPSYPKKPWRAEIYAHGRNKFLGNFATKEEATAAYQSAAKQLHGEFVRSG